MRKATNHKFRKLLLLLTITAKISLAQQGFKYRAVIGQVDSAGFYRINLQPRLVAKCKADFADLRITDANNTFVPYVLSGALPPGKQTEFVIFPVAPTGTPADTITTLVVENKQNLSIGVLWLRLKNTAVSRTVNLSGSDDLKRWFAITENVPLKQADNQTAGSYLQPFSFPASTYHYFKITVNDARKTPLSILQAGIFTEQAAPAQFVALPPPVISQTDSGKESRVSIRFDDQYQLNKLHLDILSPRFFKRNVYIYAIKGGVKTLVNEEELNANKATDLFLSAKTNHLEFQIINEDNPPVHIRRITGFEANQYVVSYLEPNKKYIFEFGNSLAEKPIYDLKFFTGSADNYIKLINHQEITVISKKQVNKTQQTASYNIIIWAAILAALLLLTKLTVKMTAEVKKRAN